MIEPKKNHQAEKISVSRAPEKGLASAVNECWCMTFVSDQLYNGKRFRALTVLDTFSRESLAIYVGKSIRDEQVCEELEKVKAARGLSQRARPATDLSLYPGHRIPGRTSTRSSSIIPGKPTDNPHIEFFNGSFWDECLNMNWLMSLEDARDKVECWRRDYYEFRPHSVTLYRMPAQFARKSGLDAV